MYVKYRVNSILTLWIKYSLIYVISSEKCLKLIYFYHSIIIFINFIKNKLINFLFNVLIKSNVHEFDFYNFLKDKVTNLL
jgi:uncharacterized phage-associated protein